MECYNKNDGNTVDFFADLNNLKYVASQTFSKCILSQGLYYAWLGKVLIDDEGMTISNPGGFIDGVNLKNLLTVEPHGRNPALADAMKRIGLAEKSRGKYSKYKVANS